MTADHVHDYVTRHHDGDEARLCRGCGVLERRGQPAPAVAILDETHVTPQRWKAPWSREQCEALRRHQSDSQYHPYTCPDHSQSEVLEPSRYGWFCPVDGCQYTQDWAFAPPSSPRLTFAINEQPCPSCGIVGEHGCYPVETPLGDEFDGGGE